VTPEEKATRSSSWRRPLLICYTGYQTRVTMVRSECVITPLPGHRRNRSLYMLPSMHKGERGLGEGVTLERYAWYMLARVYYEVRCDWR